MPGTVFVNFNTTMLPHKELVEKLDSITAERDELLRRQKEIQHHWEQDRLQAALLKDTLFAEIMSLLNQLNELRVSHQALANEKAVIDSKSKTQREEYAALEERCNMALEEKRELEEERNAIREDVQEKARLLLAFKAGIPPAGEHNGFSVDVVSGEPQTGVDFAVVVSLPLQDDHTGESERGVTVVQETSHLQTEQLARCDATSSFTPQEEMVQPPVDALYRETPDRPKHDDLKEIVPLNDVDSLKPAVAALFMATHSTCRDRLAEKERKIKERDGMIEYLRDEVDLLLDERRELRKELGELLTACSTCQERLEDEVTKSQGLELDLVLLEERFQQLERHMNSKCKILGLQKDKAYWEAERHRRELEKLGREIKAHRKVIKECWVENLRQAGQKEMEEYRRLQEERQRCRHEEPKRHWEEKERHREQARLVGEENRRPESREPPCSACQPGNWEGKEE